MQTQQMLLVSVIAPILLLLVAHMIVIEAKVKLRVSKISEFPFSANKMFEIEITTTDPNGLLTDSVQDTMVILIKSNEGIVLEKAILDYGFKDMIDQEYRGQLMRIPIWQKTPDTNSVIAKISFTRLANNGTLEIYQLSADSQAERRDKLQELPDTLRIYQRRIELLVPPKLDLAIEASDGRKNEFVLDNQGVAYCRAYDGVPVARPEFLNAAEFEVEDSVFSESENRIVLRLRVSVQDHLKTLQCRAGTSEASVKIIVLHHPSQVTLEPEIGQGATIENGSSVACMSVDGHPSPTMRWVLVSGPPNASGYFNISADGRMLHLSGGTPLGSQWAFNCTATNLLPSSRRTFNRTVEFSVGHRTPEEITFQIIVGVCVMGAIIIFCIVIVFIVCIARRSCASRPPDSRGSAAVAGARKNGLPSKTAAEKKALEAEQVTLLPPAMPQNHMDSGNTGPGYPLPPPEYHIMHENEVNQVNASLEQQQQHQQQVNGELYPEVTYAELNTSDLPMKEVKSLKASQNDEHVIYSQIIGTIMTPDCPQRGGGGGPGGYMDPDNV